MSRQLIDAGDNTDTTKLVNALSSIHGCCSNWECIITHPTYIKIGAETNSNTPKPQQDKKPEKKSFWKRLFG